MGPWFSDRLRLNFWEILGKLNGRPALVALQTASENNGTRLSQLANISVFRRRRRVRIVIILRSRSTNNYSNPVMKETKVVNVITT